MMDYCREDLFLQGVRKDSRTIRLYDGSTDSYHPYELALLRIDTGDDKERKLLCTMRREAE